MLDLQRQKNIIELLKQYNNIININELTSKLFVSEATIRRDLSKLEEAGLIKRIHGGAMLIAGPESEIPLLLRERERVTEKQNIAAKAVQYIHDGCVIILDASSTVFHLVPLLVRCNNLTVITNGPKTALELASLHIKTMVTGGIMLENSLAFVGRKAEHFIADINADILFFSCRGVSSEGFLTDSSLEEASIRQEMLHHAKKRIALCDSSKLGIEYTYNICHINDTDKFISEKT